MRTIKNNLFQRLVAQAEEADRQGLVKVADGLTDQVIKNAETVRTDDAFYSYASEQLESDLNNQLWGAIVRIADFYDIKYFNADQVQSTIDKVASELVSELCTQAGITHGVGAYEEAVPGQQIEHVAIELTEDDE